MLGLAFAPRVAWAEASFALTWRSEAGAALCVNEAALRDAVEKKLGRNPFTDRDRAAIVIEGDESRAGARFRARVTQRGRSGAVLGSRELEASSCASLIRTAAIVVALFIEPGDGAEPVEPVDGGKPVEERGPTEEPRASAGPEEARAPTGGGREPAPDMRRSQPRRPPDAPSVASTPPFALSLGFGGAAAVGFLPSPSVSLRGVARLERPGSRFSFEWSGGYSLPQSFRDGWVRATFAAVDQQLRACVAVAQTKLSLDACGGVFWGAIAPTVEATTAGILERSAAWRPVVGPSATVALRLRDAAHSARLDLGLAAPPARRAFYYSTTDGEVERFYTTGQVIGFIGLSGLITIF